MGADGDRLVLLSQSFYIFRVEQVDLVETENFGVTGESDFFENGSNGQNPLVKVRFVGVHKVEEYIRVFHLLQGGSKGTDKSLGQVANESHRVGHDDFLLTGKA